MDQSTQKQGQGQIIDIIYFLLVNLSFLFLSAILWNIIWIKKHGGMVPISKGLNENELLLYFHSKDISFVLKELYKRLTQFEKSYMINSLGMEAYLYLLFQRKIILIIFIMCIISSLIALVTTLSNLKEIKESTTFNLLHDFFLNNKFMNDFSSYMHILSLVFLSFIHYRYMTMFKTECKFLYFERFDKMSRYKNYEWLRCRTLHLSGIAPHERNTSLLKKKLDLYLQNNGGGKVIDINFIPDYSNILELEIEKSEILDFKKIINPQKDSSCVKKCIYPPIYSSEESMERELERLETNINKEILRPVYSSGHAFICFDSLLSSYTVLTGFHEDLFKKIKMKCNSICENIRSTRKNTDLNQSTFGRFYDEDLHLDIMDHDEIDILVDHMIEPNDVIWTNVGGDSGLFIIRRILLNICTVLILLFLTTPTALFSAIKYVDYYKLLEFQWAKDIPFGNLIKIYVPPLVILLINTLLILAIDYSAYFEKHYTHTRCQYSIFTKSLFYLILNMLVIPGITMAHKKLQSLYNLMSDSNYSIADVLSRIYLADYGYFYVVIIIQSGTLSGIFYLTRLGELIGNRMSSFFAFYKRYFLNLGNPWQRRDRDIFQYGFFFANMLSIYTIIVVFSSTVPFICFGGLYYFIIKHIVDMICLLTINREEMDSSGEQINNVIKYSSVPIFIYQTSMISFFIINKKYSAAIVTAIVSAICVIYVLYFNTRYIFDVYALYDKIKNYEHFSDRIPVNEISKWRNKYKHPLVIPNFVELKEEEIKIDPKNEERDKFDSNSLNINLSLK